MEFGEFDFEHINESDKRRREWNLAKLKERPLAIDEPPKPPDQLIVTTGDEGIIQDTTEIFFQEILDYLGTVPRARIAWTEVERFSLARPYIPDTSNPAHIMPEYSLELLVVKDSAVASAISRRNDGNYVEGSWASFLNPDLINRIQRGFSPDFDPYIRIDL